LQAGVSLVWLIDPTKRTAIIFRQDEGPITIGEDGVLDGDEVLPGFTLPLAKLLACTPRASRTRSPQNQ
jgi:Uma2 family endonuclease